MNVTEYFDDFVQSYRLYKGGNWCYEDGCIYRGLELLHTATGEDRWLNHLISLSNRQIAEDGALAGYSPEEYNIDHIMAGRILFRLHRLTGENRYRRAADTLAGQLRSHPRTEAGNYWHKKIYPWQVWLDGLYMGLPFQIEYGMTFGEPELVEDALAQMERALRLTKGDKGLYYHGHDERRNEAWADQVTGNSPSYWARSLGWLSMALVDTIDLCGQEKAARFGLLQTACDLFDALLGFQYADGIWLQVIDWPDLAGNYQETSASSMFAYAFMKAARIGLWQGGVSAGSKALQQLLDNHLVDGGAGRLQLRNICSVAGLGGGFGPYRDGSPEYYLSEPVVRDDAKGVGPLMMAFAEQRSLQNRLMTA
jgi:unsaturated rhamnogalacturonyl hydrolase